MDNWIHLTNEDIASYQAGALVKALQTAARLDTQADPLPEAIGQIVLEVRAAVKSGNYRCDRDTAKIPAELKKDALALVVEFARQRIRQALSQDEIRLADAARAKLTKIAEGKIAVSFPDDPEPAGLDAQTPSTPVDTVYPSPFVPNKQRFNGF